MTLSLTIDASYLERGGQQWMAESVLRDLILASALFFLLLFLGCRNFCSIAFTYETGHRNNQEHLNEGFFPQ